jgi:hypothetical protein
MHAAFRALAHVQQSLEHTAHVVVLLTSLRHGPTFVVVVPWELLAPERCAKLPGIDSCFTCHIYRSDELP